jgi:hypothetical protein
MKLNAEVGGIQWTKENDPRRLRVGEFMRKYNIDEVPQFWNVLKGDMSLVGPRPERPELIENFKEEITHYNARHFGLPGLSGYAQVNGLRGDTDLRERVRYDLFYLENWSLWLDVQIMIGGFFSASFSVARTARCPRPPAACRLLVEPLPPMRQRQIQRRTDRHNPSRIDVIVRVVIVALDVVEVHRRRDPRLLVEVHQIAL